MKNRLFYLMFFCFFAFAVAITAQSATGNCAPKKTKLNIKKLTLTKNDTYTLRIYNSKKKQTVNFVSDDPNIVSVKENASNGKSAVVTAVNIGTTCVRAHIYIRKSKLVRTLKTTIRVAPLAVSIKFAQRKIHLNVSDTMKLSVLIKPNLSQELPLFKSSNDDVVTVNSKGIITAIAPGHATLTATLLSSGQKVKCDVYVHEAPLSEEPEPEE